MRTKVTVGGLRTVLDCMAQHGVPRICFSDSIGSFGEGGGCYAGRWLTENPSADPGSDYGLQKRECRELMKIWVEEGAGCFSYRQKILSRLHSTYKSLIYKLKYLPGVRSKQSPYKT